MEVRKTADPKFSNNLTALQPFLKKLKVLEKDSMTGLPAIGEDGSSLLKGGSSADESVFYSTFINEQSMSTLQLNDQVEMKRRDTGDFTLDYKTESDGSRLDETIRLNSITPSADSISNVKNHRASLQPQTSGAETAELAELRVEMDRSLHSRDLS